MYFYYSALSLSTKVDLTELNTVMIFHAKVDSCENFIKYYINLLIYNNKFFNIIISI